MSHVSIKTLTDVLKNNLYNIGTLKELFQLAGHGSFLRLDHFFAGGFNLITAIPEVI